ncbi:hypothetical protein XSR1_320005 [Xenorhabdus szentirmaii DSM 16338]|uniref:Uncharacterized protein n=1 Tax=Xenorhabdus szentirmaii DSM 16338 TaxID=1427518 RepID=W1J0Z1_9GAMM|nr:hypothetical protein XSR1_320005 [Xenorhabdus szentirmaii DSM 16338]
MPTDCLNFVATKSIAYYLIKHLTKSYTFVILMPVLMDGVAMIILKKKMMVV